MLKIVIAGVLSAALFQTAPTPTPENLNNVGVETKVQAVQAATTEKVEQKALTEPQAPTPEIQAVAIRQLSPHEDLMQQAGIPQKDWAATDYIISHESSWRSTATNSESGAYGLCQALPATKMASAGGDYKTNPVTQLKWCHQYAHARYGGWWSSFAFWQSNRWW